jgi:hypothetical protein
MSGGPTLVLDGDIDRKQRSDTTSKATRHLCAGVYLDRRFRNMIIHRIHNDPRRRIAPSYGFDLVPVVRHAWYAWLCESLFHTCLLLTPFLIGITWGWLTAALLLCIAAALAVASFGVQTIPAITRLKWAAFADQWAAEKKKERRSQLEPPKIQLNRQIRRFKRTFGIAVACLIIPVVVLLANGESVADRLRQAAIGMLMIVLCGGAYGAIRQLALNHIRHATTVRPRKLRRREKVIDGQQTHPCIIYRRPPDDKEVDPLSLLLRQDGDPSPFIGAGKLVNRWLPPMTIQLIRPGAPDLASGEYEQAPFTAHALVRHLRSTLEQLATGDSAESIPDLRVRDRIYVAEQDISSDRRLLSSSITDFELRQVINNHRTLAHHFLEASAPIADGELVVTVLVRVSIKGRCLSLDVATCALTRTPQSFHVIDVYGESGPAGYLRQAFRSICQLPLEFRRVPTLALAPWTLARAWWSTKDRTSLPRRKREVGPELAAREEKAIDWKHAQLDRTTIYDHMKIIEQRIIRSTEDFLAEHNVDTTAFQKQATNIINSGVLNMGGSMDISNSALGAGAQWVQTQIAQLSQYSSTQQEAATA